MGFFKEIKEIFGKPTPTPLIYENEIWPTMKFQIHEIFTGYSIMYVPQVEVGGIWHNIGKANNLPYLEEGAPKQITVYGLTRNEVVDYLDNLKK